jgi:hypothetical protein
LEEAWNSNSPEVFPEEDDIGFLSFVCLFCDEASGFLFAWGWSVVFKWGGWVGLTCDVGWVVLTSG